MLKLRVRVPPRRARHPERTVVYRLFEGHFERYVREYEEH